MSTRTLRHSRNTSRYRILRMGCRMSRKLGALVSFVLAFAFATTFQTQASARSALDGSARGAAITCITAYQNHVSPYKGFSCASTNTAVAASSDETRQTAFFMDVSFDGDY